MRRPKGVRFWTVHDLAAWIADTSNVPLSTIPNDERADPQWAHDAAMWFWAYRQSEGFFDYRRKDFASMLIGGQKALTHRDVSQELRSDLTDEVHEDFARAVREHDEWVERELREFYKRSE